MTAAQSHNPASTGWTDGPMVAFDLETTGVDRFADVPVSAALVYFEAGQPVGSDCFLIDPGRPIPAEATAVHGITGERAQSEGVPLAAGTAWIYAALSMAARLGWPVVGMNLAYDLTMADQLAGRFLRRGLADLGLRVLDVLVIDRALDRYRKGRRTLTDLAAHYQVPFEHAHDARADAQAAVGVLRAQAERYRLGSYLLPGLVRLQAKWHQRWAAHYSQYRTDRGQTPLDPAEFMWPIAQPDSQPRCLLPGSSTADRPLAATSTTPAGDGSDAATSDTDNPAIEPAPALQGSATTGMSSRSRPAPVTAEYGRIARVYHGGGGVTVWFQPDGHRAALKLAIPHTSATGRLAAMATQVASSQVGVEVVRTARRGPADEGELLDLRS